MLLNAFDSIDKLFLTLTLILIITNLVYQFMAKYDRPLVLGGILAGVIINHLDIPEQYFDINTCAGLGQMGIVLFMTMVGNQLSYKDLFRRRSQMPITLLNMLVPFVLGFGFAWYLLQNQVDWFGNLHTLIPNSVADSSILSDDPRMQLMFEIFIGLTVSMTAFPIISMFLGQADMVDTIIGRIALLCGFVDEIFLWLVLGFVLISSQQNAIITSFKPAVIIIYLVFIVFIAPKIVTAIVNRIKSERGMIVFMLLGSFISAALADIVDLHQVFGGFLFGLILPRDNELIIAVRNRLSDMVTVVLLPVYFVETGISTNIHISFNLTTVYLILIFTSIAFIGKFSGGFVTGKIFGASNKESVLLGSVLNMRGIIEIILLNIGLEIGIISDRIYTVLVVMTLICTSLATSLSLYLNKKLRRTTDPQ